jgi:hypothetical protein
MSVCVEAINFLFKVSLFLMFNNIDVYLLSIKATIDESQLRNYVQAELKATDDCVTDGSHTAPSVSYTYVET